MILFRKARKYSGRKAFFGLASFLWFFVVVYQTAAGNMFLEPIHPAIPWFVLFLFAFLFFRFSSDEVLLKRDEIVVRSGLNKVRIPMKEVFFVGYFQSYRRRSGGLEVYPDGTYSMNMGGNRGIRIVWNGGQMDIFTDGADKLYGLVNAFARQ